MRKSTKRLLALVASIPVALTGFALLYMAGMAALEGKPRDFWSSLAWASETLTTTGYGFDSHWDHPAMVLLVIAVQVFGVFLVFLVFPIYLIPFLEERFETRLPRAATDLKGHVVIYRHGPAVEMLLEELDRARVPYLVLEEDAATARRLVEEGHPVLLRKLDEQALEAASLARARALIANGSDSENASAVLAARQSGFQGEIAALVQNPEHRHPMLLAGASSVFTPLHVLAAALAARATSRLDPLAEDAHRVGSTVEVSEVRIQPTSAIAGKTLAEAAIGARTGAIVVGQWIGGTLVTNPQASLRLEPRGILVAVGRHEALDRLHTLAGGGSDRRRSAAGVLVVGCGEVGRKVRELLRVAGEEAVALDRNPATGADVVGSAFDRGALEAANAAIARAAVLALDSDAATLFATVILRDLCPDLPIYARVNQIENVQNIHRAGADLAISVSQIAGKILASRLLGKEVVSIDPLLRVLGVSSRGLAGRVVSELDIRTRTGCSVVLVERGSEVLTEIRAGFRFAPGDAVYVAGTEEATARFLATFPQDSGHQSSTP